MVLELRRLVSQAVGETKRDSMLLSGGLDTGIIAAVMASLLGNDGKKKFRGYTVILKGAPSPDIRYSESISNQFGIPTQILKVDLTELEALLPEVIKDLKSLDPMEIRNSVVVYIGLMQAKLDGYSKVKTGDTSDELFAGYSFIYKLPREKARQTLLHLWQSMHFSSVHLAKSLGSKFATRSI
ncbi:MAG: asparagine synthase C-terminal domain-containing protein [Nitrososphaerales archaeon]